MNAISEFSLRAKHWQLFLLLVVVLGLADAPALWWELPGNGGWRMTFLPLFLSSELCAIVYAFWFGSWGTFLNNAVSPPLRLRVRLFRIAVVFPAVYFPLFELALLSLSPALFLVIFPLHLFATFCLFYNLYFVSKSLVLAEKGVRVEFPNYIGTLFLIWFFPIGVWFVQPRINHLYARVTQPADCIGPSLRSG